MVGKYLIEVWKSLGVDTEGGQVEFVWASEEIRSREEEYRELVDDISMSTNLNRVMRYGFMIFFYFFFSILRIECAIC